MKKEILIVKIHNALKEGKSHYEATRGKWRINKARLNYIQYVVGIDQGEVVCAFKPIKWCQVEAGKELGRSFFEGKNVDVEFLSKLQDSKELLISKFGQGKAVAYGSISEIE